VRPTSNSQYFCTYSEVHGDLLDIEILFKEAFHLPPVYSPLKFPDIALINLLHVYRKSSTLFKILFRLNKMKYVTELVSVILVALLANTANAAPNYPGPSTSSVVDFTLYKTPAPNQNQCYDSVDFVNVASSDLVYTGDGAGSTVCNPGDFYVAQIDSVAWDWTCQRMYSYLHVKDNC